MTDCFETLLPDETPRWCLRDDKNRITGEDKESIILGPGVQELMLNAEAFRTVRRRAVQEREQYIALKKQSCDPALARYFKAEEKSALRRERSATLLVDLVEGDKPQSTDTYYWPVELAGAIEAVITEAFFLGWAQ